MTGNDLQMARCYKELPVWVVEDHNDVLPHIYRAIATRHLPFQGITMLHFDSHPDLQIATEMDADIVFDKFELFSSLSIENWILPAVYAGHFNHVVWMKPVWADQLPEGSKRVFVGKHCQSKKLRISWPDSYFLSDLLYASKDDQESSRELTVDVVTMETDLLRIDCNVSRLDGQSQTRCKCRGIGEQGMLDSCRSSGGGQGVSAIGFTGCCDSASDQTVLMSGSLSESPQLTDDGGQTCEHCRAPREVSTSDTCREAVQPGATPHNPEAPGCRNLTDSTPGEPRGPLSVASAAMAKSSATVLDIDLDFFSTRNPFKEIYPEPLFRQLEDLYSFEGPVDDSATALKECSQKRAVQLSELEIALKLAVDGEEMSDDAVSNERFNRVKSFVDALREAHHVGDAEPLDAEMIHMAGLTCDDSGELPHHVSTEEEIASLLAAMETLLSRLTKPVMVTVARSSHDDYCPPEQVDNIQQKVLKMLQNVYGKIDVHLAFETQAEGTDKS